ncbi:hypothetical protein [Nocardia vaccinii]|uniref:hypothetical protein n=1 Tax=Nocardia vaccinii TaxID=1822 RepID=UPI0008363BD6|nr:hypothetical protein [Nocardia vaccinii]
MTDPIIVRGGPGGTLFVGPETAPVLGEGAAPLDTAVLEVRGGHLVWSVLAGQLFPAAVIDDADAAQEWIWAVFGARIALAVADFDGTPTEFVPEPALPALVGRVRKLGYAHWAARWWPASTLDDIPPLDERLVDIDIATLTSECDLLVDGADAIGADTDDDLAPRPGADRAENLAPRVDRAEDYALAAGPAADTAFDALILARGVGGWDWRRCPPGIVDASERALSWEVLRRPGATVFQVSAVAAPRPNAAVPPHLWPRARLRSPAATAVAELTLSGDVWTGAAFAPDRWESAVTVEVYVPGVGPADSADPGDARIRPQLREFAATRLRNAGRTPDDTTLLAEIAAATTDMDF